VAATRYMTAVKQVLVPGERDRRLDRCRPEGRASAALARPAATRTYPLGRRAAVGQAVGHETRSPRFLSAVGAVGCVPSVLVERWGVFAAPS